MKIHVKHVLATLAVSSLTIGGLSTGVVLLSADSAIAKSESGGGKSDDNRGGSRSDKARGNDKAGKSDHSSNRKGSEKKKGKLSDWFKSKTKTKTKTHTKSDVVTNRNKPAKIKKEYKQVTRVERSPHPKIRPTEHKGSLASELKGLNAAHASPNALANASPNSQVGRIAAYRDAVLDADATRLDLADKQDFLAELDEAYTGRNSADIMSDIDLLDPADPDNADLLTDLNTELSTAELYEETRTTLVDDIQTLETAAYDAETLQGDALLTASNGRELSPEALAEFHRLLSLDPPETTEIDLDLTDVDIVSEDDIIITTLN